MNIFSECKDEHAGLAVCWWQNLGVIAVSTVWVKGFLSADLIKYRKWEKWVAEFSCIIHVWFDIE